MPIPVYEYMRITESMEHSLESQLQAQAKLGWRLVSIHSDSTRYAILEREEAPLPVVTPAKKISK